MDIITLGIGAGGTLNGLVLTGLNPGGESLPPRNIGLILEGQFELLFSNELSEGGIVSEPFILPSYPVQLTWEIVFGSAPSVASIILQGSLDGINWSQLDISLNVNGEIRTVRTGAKFGRAQFGEMDDGIATTVSVVVQPYLYGPQ